MFNVASHNIYYYNWFQYVYTYYMRKLKTYITNNLKLSIVVYLFRKKSISNTTFNYFYYKYTTTQVTSLLCT